MKSKSRVFVIVLISIAALALQLFHPLAQIVSLNAEEDVIVDVTEDNEKFGTVASSSELVTASVSDDVTEPILSNVNPLEEVPQKDLSSEASSSEEVDQESTSISEGVESESSEAEEVVTGES